MLRFAFVFVFSLAAMLVNPVGIAQVANQVANVDSASAQAESGPTPYPKDAKDWPGKGAIRVFSYMNEYRRSFWSERDRKQGSVVFVGDSLIGNWKTLAKDMPGIAVANRGLGGETTRGLLFRFKEDVLDLHPKAIVLLSGSNDLSAQQDIQQTRSNIIEMLDMAEREAPGVPIVVCTIPPRDNPKSVVDPKRLVELNKLIASTTQGRKQVVVLDLYTQLVDPDGLPNMEYFSPDRLHMSVAGLQRFHDALMPALKRFNVG